MQRPQTDQDMPASLRISPVRQHRAGGSALSRFCVILAVLMMLLPVRVAADPVKIPNFWDLKRKLDKPDLTTLRQIRFLTESDYPPFHFIGPDGQLTGFEVELAREICEHLKVTCSIQPIRWDGLADALQRGQGDAIIAAMRISPESRRRFLFTQTYFRSPARFVAAKATAVTAPGVEGFAGQRIAVAARSVHESYLRAMFPGANLLPTSHATKALEAVRDGDAGVAFVDGTVAAFWLNDAATGACCAFLGGPYTEPRIFGEGAGIAVRRDAPALRQALDWALHRLAADGIYAKLYLKYFPVGVY